MNIKSCLKHTRFPSSSSPCSGSPSPGSGPSRPSVPRPSCSRSVSFREKDSDEIHPADDWDRSPVDIASKLSYDDILELKQMQVAVARACARAHTANGSTSRFLSNVPVALLPLLPESPAPTCPRSPTSPTSGPFAASFGRALSEACLCKAFNVDAGVSGSRVCEHARNCKLHSNSIPSSPKSTGPTSPNAGAYVHPASLIQTPSPPDTPPRPLVTSIPPPPPRRARNFTFLPLLDTPNPTPMATPSTSGLSSPNDVLSPSSSSGALSPPHEPTGAYSAYNPFAGFSGVGGSATLGLERKLGFASSDSSRGSGSEGETEDEDEDWPHDWPGARKHIVHHGHNQIHNHNSDRARCHAKSGAPSPLKAQLSSAALPPSPPAETRTLPPAPPSPVVAPSSPRTAKLPSPLRVNGPPARCSAAAPPTPSSPTSPAPREPIEGRDGRDRTSPQRANARKMSLPLVMLA